MKLAEALAERAAAQTRLAELQGRLEASVLVQEGDEPAAERPVAAKARKEKPVRKERERERELPETSDEEIVDAPEEAFAEDEDEDEPTVVVADHRLCRVCNLRKRSSEFSPREDMCLDCYMGRDELLKEIIARRRRKSKPAAPRAAEENVERSGMEDNIDSLGSMDFGISLPE